MARIHNFLKIVRAEGNLTAENPGMNYFSIAIWMIKIAGISFESKQSVLYTAYSLLSVSMYTIYPMILLRSVLLENDKSLYVNAAFSLPPTLEIVLKNLFVLWKRKDIIELLRQLEGGVEAPDNARCNDDHDKDLRKCIHKINFYGLVLLTTYIGLILVAFVKCISVRVISGDSNDWKFQTGPIHGFYSNHSPFYEILLVYETATTTIMVFSHIGTLMIVVGCMMHVTDHYTNLNHYIESIGHRHDDEWGYNSITPAYEEVSDMSGHQYPYRSLTKAVRYHNAIMALTKQIEVTLLPIFLVIFLLTAISSTFILYVLSTMAVSDDKFFFNVFCLVMGWHRYILCYWGQRVSDGSLNVATSCSNPNFIDADVPFKKGLMLMILAAQRSKHLTAGKFLAMSLQTVIAMNRASYSYYAVLRTMHDH